MSNSSSNEPENTQKKDDEESKQIEEAENIEGDKVKVNQPDDYLENIFVVDGNPENQSENSEGIGLQVAQENQGVDPNADEVVEVVVEPQANELQAILDHLIQSNMGQVLQENAVNDVIDDVAGAVFQNVEIDRLLFIMEQLNELFPEEDEMNDLIPEDDNAYVVANPGDYIFGNRNMERVMARLFEEEIDNDGPPPMDPEDINNIETTMLDQEVLDKTSSCSVCLDSFRMNEEVNVLGCGHFYHAFCIKHWLGMHATCPVCRKEEEGRDERDGEED